MAPFISAGNSITKNLGHIYVVDLVADRCGGSCGELEIWDRHVVDLVADRCGGSCGKRTKAPYRARLPSLKTASVLLPTSIDFKLVFF